VQIDRLSGGGSVNTTHLMAFQELVEGTRRMSKIQSAPRRKSRQLFYEDLNVPYCKIDKNKQPQIQPLQHSFNSDNQFNMNYFIWTYLRHKNSFDQIIPNFKGWMVQVRDSIKTKHLVKTVETFLPPITAKVTEFSTIRTYLDYLQVLSKSVNMPYVNVTLDVGAAINAFKTIWNYPEHYKDIVIHLGGFHFLKENFQVIIF